MKKEYAFGIIGCGNIAPFHAESIQSIGQAKLVAVCDIAAEKAEAFAQKYHVEKIYTDYMELIHDRAVDIVCVCTPSGIHGDAVIAAARAGKHIFCEKPIEIRRERLDQMIKEVRTSGVKMACVFQLRTSATAMAVKQALNENRFGRIILADAYQKTFRSQAYYDSADWRGTWALDGGGALMNQVIHSIDLLIWLAGDVDSLFARAETQVRCIDVEDTAVAVLKFKNGAIGVIEGTTSVYPAQDARIEIHGERGTVIFNSEKIIEWRIEGNESEELPDNLSSILTPKDNPRDLSRLGHRPLLVDLISAIEEDREPAIPPEEGRKAVDLILNIYESAKAGKEVLTETADIK